MDMEPQMEINTVVTSSVFCFGRCSVAITTELLKVDLDKLWICVLPIITFKLLEGDILSELF